MKKFLASVAIAAVTAGCASHAAVTPPDFTNSKATPLPANGEASTGPTLPLIGDFANVRKTETASPGTKRPRKSEMSGSTWKPKFHPDSEYIIPFQTTNGDGTRPRQMVTVTSDLPAGKGYCATTGVEAMAMGYGVVFAPFPGQPVGTQTRCTAAFGGRLVKIILEAQSHTGPAEVRIDARTSRENAVPQGVCQDAHYKVSKLVEGGPLGACVMVDATGAGTKTYVKLPGNTRNFPAVKSDDGKGLRMANFTTKRLPSGEPLIEIGGAARQVALTYQTGEVVYLTRGE